MDFLNSLSEVAKNNKNFNRWEQEQRDNEAQRKELYNRKNYTPEEIEAAKQLGERIIDVVDIMDNHSENVAENVETATAPIVSLAPILGALIPGVYYVKNVLKKSVDAKWDIDKQMFWDNEDARKLADEITEDIHKTRPNKDGFYYWDFISEDKVKKIPNPELKARAMELYNEYAKKVKPYNRKIKGGAIGVVASSVLAFIAANIYSAKLQVDSSKIARYQARKILEDPKAFVNYTPEQIAAAKKYIEEHPELKKQKQKEKLKSGMFKSIINILRDRKAYKNAKKSDTDESKKVTRPLSPEEIVQAKKDKEVIQRSVRIINNEAEKYSENMEVAAGVILGSTPIVGGLVGWLTGVLMNKTGLTNSIVAKIVNKNGSEEAKQAYARFKELKPGAPGYTTRWSKFVDKLMKDEEDINLRNDIENFGAEVKKQRAKKDIIKPFKKAFAAGLSHKWFNSKIIGLIGAVVSSIPAALIALKLQKSSARAGRYTAKRELEQDPRNFIGYTEEDLEEVKDVKGEKETFGQKLKEYALFVPTVLKQYYAYDKYKRTEFKEHQLLLDELKKADVTETQLQDAKNLQRKLFNTFEKVDDNSQIYSESMEAATEILQPFALSAGILVAVFPAIYVVWQLAHNKISAASAVDWVTKKLANASKFLKSKTFKKYLNAVAEKVPHKVGNVELQNKPLAALIQGIDFNNDKIGEIGAKLAKNLNISSEQFRYMNNFEQIALIERIEKSINNLAAVADVESTNFKPALDKIKLVFSELKSEKYSSKLRADMFDIMIKNTDRVSRMSDSDFNAAISKFVDISYLLNKESIDYMVKSWSMAPLDKIPPQMQDFVKRFRYNYRVDGQQVDVWNPKGFKKAIADSISKNDVVLVYKYIDDIFGTIAEKFPYTLKEIPEGLDNIIEFFQTNAGRNADYARIAGMVEGEAAAQASANRPFQSLFKKLSEPKEYLSTLKNKIEKMTDAEFQAHADSRHFSSMDKKTMLNVLSNLEKIFDNIPKDELNGIKNAMLKELKEHPDEFMKALRTGQLPAAFLTDGLVKAAAAAGISWTVLNIALIWAIQTWLADIQLKSGRLGVMKALEALDDPAYYANIIPDSKAVNTYSSASSPQTEVSDQTSVIPVAPQNGSLLDKFKK